MTPPFHRRIELDAGDGTVTATVEDYNHHFDLRLTHDAALVTGFSVDPVRAPWSQCPGAAAELDELVGRPVGVRPTSASPDRHCTHLIDLACVAVRFAGSTGRRRYDVTVTDWDQATSTAAVQRDDGLRVEWQVGRMAIEGPDPYTGRSLGAGFTPWALRELHAEVAEAALILRRAAWMSPSRGFDLDAFATVADTGLGEGVCFATQPERIHLATRNLGTARVTVQSPRRD
ncbi:MAG: hypothetical protein JWN29_476 [Acidimicrobiales bacterium]|nr:hypothetical protein [Acidimicrobiales bacterium]